MAYYFAGHGGWDYPERVTSTLNRSTPTGCFFYAQNEGDTLAFEQFDDMQLADHLNAVIAEQERRARLAAVPAQIRDLATRYIEDGGDPAELTLPGGADA